jgi:hypothetical protein
MLCLIYYLHDFIKGVQFFILKLIGISVINFSTATTLKVQVQSVQLVHSFNYIVIGANTIEIVIASISKLMCVNALLG